MEAGVRVVKRFQTVALAATAAAVGYTLLHEPAASGRPAGAGEQPAESARRQAHSLAGEMVDRDQQSALARALDTDCEACLETRRKLFGMFGAAKGAGGGKGGPPDAPDAGGSPPDAPPPPR